MKNKFLTLFFTTFMLVGCGKCKRDPNNTSSTNKPNSTISSNKTSSSSKVSSSSSLENNVSSTGKENTSSSSSSSNQNSSSSSSSSLGNNSSSSSSSLDNNSSSSPNEQETSVQGIYNISNVNHKLGVYFDALYDVYALDNLGNDITHLIKVNGHVNYGREGEYKLKYSIGDFVKERVVKISSSYNSIYDNSKHFEALDISNDRISYDSNITHPINPNYIAKHLLTNGIKTNSWWSPLVSNNRGDGHGIYTNPLKSSLTPEGVEVTNPGAGFTQFWATGTQAQFSVPYKDIIVNNRNLTTNYTSSVISYSDNSVQVALRENNVDELVVSYSQGSPFIYFEAKDQLANSLSLDTTGVDNYSFLTLEGEEITEDTYTSDALVIRFNHRHIGYNCQKPEAILGGEYADCYFLVNVPEETTFSFANLKSPGGFFDKINISLGNDNMFSIGAINSLEEAPLLHNYAYSIPLRNNTNFKVDHQTSEVETSFDVNVNSTRFDNDGALYLLPHQYKKSNVTTSDINFRTVRGNLKLVTSNSFKTSLEFKGVLPTLSKPLNNEFSNETLKSYLNNLLEVANNENEGALYVSKTPYWNGKILYSLANGIIQAKQINDEDLANKLLTKCKTLLEDWFSYTSSSDDRYLHYNSSWGTIYYSNNDFDTAKTLSDHHFTHGYLVYASAITMMYDSKFKNDYLGITDSLLKDYMNYDKEDNSFPYLRTYDAFAGHSWASGISVFAEGNNQESSGEALNSWVAGYLLGLVSGNNTLVDTAIYGYVNELYSIKTYWFDYDKDIFSEKYASGASCAGMIWGGKYDYATWFGADPTFIYGIHYLPTGEYLTSYALGSNEKQRLNEIYNSYLASKNGTINTWFSNMWSIGSVCDASSTLKSFDASKILNDDYPNELANCYYFINALKSFNNHSLAAKTSINYSVATSVYQNGDDYYAICLNPTSTSQKVRITIDGKIKEIQVTPNTFTSYKF